MINKKIEVLPCSLDDVLTDIEDLESYENEMRTLFKTLNVALINTKDVTEFFTEGDINYQFDVLGCNLVKIKNKTKSLKARVNYLLEQNNQNQQINKNY